MIGLLPWFLVDYYLKTGLKPKTEFRRHSTARAFSLSLSGVEALLLHPQLLMGHCHSPSRVSTLSVQ